MSKGATLLLIGVLMLSSLVIVDSAFAQSIPKPSVPEFSLKLVTYPYDVVPVTILHPNFGKIVINQTIYRVEDRSIEIAIRNQPFTSFSINGSTVILYFQVQIKGHNSDSNSWLFYSFSNSITPIQAGYYFTQTDSNYTIISVPTFYPYGAQVDFQVRVLIGYVTMTNHGLYGFADWLDFHGETGDWSSTQTVTIPAATSSSEPVFTPTLTPSPEPTSPPPYLSLHPELIVLTIMLLAVIAVGFGFLLYLKKRK